jgi:hypothetical protein
VFIRGSRVLLASAGFRASVIGSAAAQASKQEIETADERKARKWACGGSLFQAKYRVDRGA